MFQNFIQTLKGLFVTKPCETCLAKDYFISALKEELRAKNALIETLSLHEMNINEHLLRMNKNVESSGDKVINITRQHAHSFGNKIARAEEASRKKAEEEGLIEKRKKEYNERVDSLMKGMDTEQKKEEVAH